MEMILDGWVCEEGFDEDEHDDDEDEVHAIFDELIFDEVLVDLPEFVEDMSSWRDDKDGEGKSEEGDEICIVEDESKDDFHLTYIISLIISSHKFLPQQL